MVKVTIEMDFDTKEQAESFKKAFDKLFCDSHLLPKQRGIAYQYVINEDK